MPALLTNMSTVPSVSVTSATIRSTSSVFETSACTAIALRPSARISAQTFARQHWYAKVDRHVAAGAGQSDATRRANATAPAGDKGDLA